MTTRSTGFSRLHVDERRRELLETGRSLFSTRPYAELSMAEIAREAGISKALLYHYFPSKQAYFIATLEGAAGELAQRVRPDESDPPPAQLATALGAWLEWVDANRDAYSKLLQSAYGAAEVREIVEEVREQSVAQILARLSNGQPAPPEVRATVCGWLGFVERVCLDWVQRDEMDRETVRDLLLGVLPGALEAAGHPELATRVRTA
jgi:AcrR family transcriptional regulator